MDANYTPSTSTFTTSSIFLKTLRDAGITHAFVNWGSDHPAMLEDIERQRIYNGNAEPCIITCPNEMVALSAAHGYALVAGKPAAVLVHVDVGTQALAGAVHNADRGRVPVLIYAGAAPFALSGELKGSRNEFIFWLQDIPDQPAIVRQYMRFTSEINSPQTVSQVVMRALQFASSDPKGPVYLWGRREIMEEEALESTFNRSLSLEKWSPPNAVTIPRIDAKRIAHTLIEAKNPLIITSYLGRDPSAIPRLVSLSELLAIPVYTSCPTVLSFPHNHPYFVGLSYGIGENSFLREADAVLILDSDVPWIPQHNKPHSSAKVYHIDVDVLKPGMGMFHVGAEGIWKANASLAIEMILDEVSEQQSVLDEKLIESRKQKLINAHNALVQELDKIERTYPEDGSFTVPNLICALRKAVPQRTLFLNEAISNYPSVWSHIRPIRPASIFTSGASSLGWGLGAAIGASLAMQILQDAANEEGKGNEFICLIVGDGSYLFGVPSSAYWMARRYNTPFLTIVLNNGGWKSPKLSMLGVYPNGFGSSASGQNLNISFLPDAPNFSGIAIAAGGAWGKKVSRASELEHSIREAIRVVKSEKRCAVLDCCLEMI